MVCHKKIVCFSAVLAAVAGFAADPAWPADFNSRMEARIAETTPVGTAATLVSSSESVVLFAGGIASSETYGDESEPFDSWFMTYGISAGHDFDSRKPVGMTIVFR